MITFSTIVIYVESRLIRSATCYYHRRHVARRQIDCIISMLQFLSASVLQTESLHRIVPQQTLKSKFLPSFFPFYDN